MRAAILPFESRGAHAHVAEPNNGEAATIYDLSLIRRARVLKETLQRTLEIKRRTQRNHDGKGGAAA
jgi:hypothetical protein